MNFPKGYAVILTEKGAEVAKSDILLTKRLPTTPMDEPETIFQEVYQRVSKMLDQQLAIEREIGSVDLQAIYNNYSLQQPITVEEIYNQIKEVTDGLDLTENNYQEYIKEFDSIITKYHDIAKKVGEELGKLIAGGRTFSLDSAISELKVILKNLQNFELDLNQIDKAILSADNHSHQNEKDIKTLYKRADAVAAKYLEGGAWNITWRKDEKMPGGRRVHITQQTKDGKNSVNDATKDLQALANEAIKRASEDAETIRKMKYTSLMNQKAGEFRKKLNRARISLANQLKMLSEEKQQKYARSATTEMFNTIADAIKYGQKTATFTVDVGYDNAALMGELMEIIHTFTLPSQEEVTTAVNSSISFTNTGELQSRETLVQVGQTTTVTYEKNKYWDFEDNEVDVLVKNYKKEDGSTLNTQRKFGKTDNLAKIRKDDGRQYYVAFNDKFYSAYNLRNIGLIGDTFEKNGEDTGSLLHNMDLFATNEALSEQLIFTLLNMSSASILAPSETDKKEVEKIVRQMVSAYITEIAWDVKALIQQMKDAPGMNESNTLCVFNFSDALFVKSSEILRGIQQQLSNKKLIEDIVAVKVAADTMHQSLPLWRASLSAEPYDQKARWNWVATQIAANTQLSVKLNVQGLLQLFAPFAQ